MSEMLDIATGDVYEPPLLRAAGDFADRTQGEGSDLPEGELNRLDIS